MQLNPLISGSLQQSTAEVHAATTHLKCSALERIPKWVICIPLTVQWIWLALRYKSLTLPSCANPAITSGGLVGEGKLEYLTAMGPVARAATAAYYPISTYGPLLGIELRQVMRNSGLTFPIIAKPNLGLCGYGVRFLSNQGELQSYLASFPRNEMVLLQAYLPAEGEAGIFYVRDPETDQGRLIGLTLRYFPRVMGNGHQTLAELINADPSARRLVASSQHECKLDMQKVPNAGEIVRLSTIGSTRVGGLYRNGSVHITEQLTQAIDVIARDMPNFYFGRFDVRFDSLYDLSTGTGFSIIEVNGAGSEAIQAWDPDVALATGLRIIFEKQKILFSIGDAMRRMGFYPIGVMSLAKLYWRQRRLISRYPPSN